MPKLNVQQNNANVIKALRNALAIGQIKGPIASDGNDNFTSTGSNRNLLDNAYFVGGGSQLGDGHFPINQRGQTSYAAYTNSIDRWYAAAAMTVAADGISCGAIVQKLPQVAPLDGKTLTFSALLADGTMLSGSAVFNSASDTYFYYDAGAGEYLLYNTYFGGFEVVTERKIAAVKLELGTVSTLATPNFFDEKKRCQSYLYVLDAPAYHFLGEVALAGDATNCTIAFHLPAEMRTTTPSVTLTSGLWVGGAQTTAVNWTRTLGATVIAACTVTGGLSSSTLYAVATGESATTITISAEL